MLGTRETGNETYIRGLLVGLAGLDDGPEVVAYVGPDHKVSVGASLGVTPSRRVRLAKLRAPGPFGRLGVELAIRARRDHLDVLHSTYVAPLGTRTPSVLTIHDTTYLRHPEWLSPRDVRVLRVGVARSIRRAAQVVVPTEAVRRDVIDAYGYDADRVHAILHGPGATAQKLSIEEARRVLTRAGADASPPYLLAVGGATPRKNLVALVEAFGRLRDFRGGLVLAGAATGAQAEAVAQAARRLAGRVVITPHLDDRIVAGLYQQARAVALPSLDEGFGLTALEAMWHGVPVAASDVPALREVCDGAARHFDPTDPEALTAALEAVLLDDDQRARMVAAGTVRAAVLTWARSAARHVEVYARAAAS